MLNLDLSDKRVLITGGTKSVGRVVTELFLAQGAKVVTSARQASIPRSVSATLGEARGCDVECIGAG